MHTVLLQFSQTGNTHRVAEAMAQAFNFAGHSTEVIAMNDVVPDDVPEGDLMGVGSPCFSSQAPSPVKEFLRGMPTLENKQAFVFATSGGAPGRILFDLASLLRNKGANVIGGFLARGEVHHPAPHMIGQFPGRPNREDLEKARQFVFNLSGCLSPGNAGLLQEIRTDPLKKSWGLYRYLGLVSSDKMLRLLMPEPKPDKVKCDQCRWCEEQCPMDNIVLRSYPILGNRCIRCYRCLSGCPQKAFEVNWRYADLILWALYNPTFMRWFGNLEPGEQIY